MDTTLKALLPDVPALLRAHGLRPEKRFSQNFLIDAHALGKVIQAADMTPGAAVLEIGAGLGSLTVALAQTAGLVVAVELDERLLPILRQTTQPYQQVRIVPGDILTMHPGQLLGDQPYVVAANIPYAITSAVVRLLMESNPAPQRVTLTVQREVAERICAVPGEMSLLALGVQVYGSARVMARLPAAAFYPAPEVDSAVVRIDRYAEALADSLILDKLFRLARAGFGQKRKTLRNAMSVGLSLPAAQTGELLRAGGIDPQRRAETLAVAEWLELARSWPD